MKATNDQLELGGVTVRFIRTLRLPEDGHVYNLPPNLGTLPVRRVDDYPNVPQAWKAHGGVFLPLFQREALWLSFGGWGALKVAAGKVNALTGGPWAETLTGTFTEPAGSSPQAVRASPSSAQHGQDYCVVPAQPWLDGFKDESETVRQFIAMALGQGYTVEGQVTGQETFGGLQLLAFAPRADGPAAKARDAQASRSFEMGMYVNGVKLSDVSGNGYDALHHYSSMDAAVSMSSYEANGLHDGDATRGATLGVTGSTSQGVFRRYDAPVTKSAEMGLAQGGRMKQKVYADPYGVTAWETSGERCFVHIVNSALWRQITGEAAPESPISAQTYAQHGLPWFDVYDEGVPAVAGSTVLAGVKPVAAMDAQHGFVGQQDDSPVAGVPVKTYTHAAAAPGSVRDGKW